MSKFPEPNTKAAGVSILVAAKVAKPACIGIQLVAKLKSVYQKLVGPLRKLGIKLPIGRDAKKSGNYSPPPAGHKSCISKALTKANTLKKNAGLTIKLRR